MQQLPDNNRGWGDRSLLRVHAALPSAPVLVATRFSKALQNLGLHHERGVKHNSCRRPRFGQSLPSLGPEGGTRDLSCSLEWGPHPVVDGWKGGRAVRPEVASSGKHHPWASLPACPLQAQVGWLGGREPALWYTLAVKQASAHHTGSGSASVLFPVVLRPM